MEEKYQKNIWVTKHPQLNVLPILDEKFNTIHSTIWSSLPER